MTKTQLPANLFFVRYQGTADFKFFEGKDFLKDHFESNDGRAEAEILIESSCPEIDEFTITDAEHDEECLSASARIAGIVLVSIPWQRSGELRPDQIKFLQTRVISYISDGVGCVQDVNVTLSTQDRKVIAAA